MYRTGRRAYIVMQKVMLKQRLRQYGIKCGQGMALCLLVVFGAVGSAAAVTSTSNNYMVTDPQFGGGSSLKDCSGQYCAQSSVGDLTNGKIGRAHV